MEINNGAPTISELIEKERRVRVAARIGNIALVEDLQHTLDEWKIAFQILREPNQIRQFVQEQIGAARLYFSGKSVDPIGVVTATLTHELPKLDPGTRDRWDTVYTELLQRKGLFK